MKNRERSKQLNKVIYTVDEQFINEQAHKMYKNKQVYVSI